SAVQCRDRATVLPPAGSAPPPHEDRDMRRPLNLTASLCLGAIVTLLLFFLMQLMLAVDATLPERGERRLIGDITLPQLEVIIQLTTPKPLEPELPETPP